MKLVDLIVRVPPELWEDSPAAGTNPEINGLCWDSRRVRPGDLFFALPGERAHGLEFLAEAGERGAAAAVISGDPTCAATTEVGSTRWVPKTAVHFTGPLYRARNARAAMALMADAFFEHPSRQLRLTGITGTDGKTTCSWMVRQILSANGRRAVAAGTLGIKGDDETLMTWDDLGARGTPSEAVPKTEAFRRWHPTTPEAPIFQAALRTLAQQGVDDVIAEISSHALVQDRTYGSRFRVVALTHVAADHLDFHGSASAYRQAKARLFNPAERGCGVEIPPTLAVLNLGDDLGKQMADQGTDPHIAVGTSPDADLRILETQVNADQTRLSLAWNQETFTLDTSLVGSFQVENLAISTAICLALGLTPAEIVRGAGTLDPVPGRFEAIRSGQPFAVIVDYAHTADALDQALAAARMITPNRLIVVFGCGGDRDATKRPAMGEVAGRRADTIILTTDNPRSEQPESIIAAIERGLPGSAEHTAWVDRRTAIAHAIDLAREGDTIFIAGRGAETVQVFRDAVRPFDDREVVRELLARRVARTSEEESTL